MRKLEMGGRRSDVGGSRSGADLTAWTACDGGGCLKALAGGRMVAVGGRWEAGAGARSMCGTL